jgi:hypothetical protein
VPPVNLTVLQSYGANAVNALNDAQLALAKGQTSGAVQQITYAESEFDALVNGLHSACAGGPHGVDPGGYTAFTSTIATLKGNLDELKRSLGS